VSVTNPLHFLEIAAPTLPPPSSPPKYPSPSSPQVFLRIPFNMTTSTPSAYQCAHVPQLNGTQPYPDPIALQSLENSAASGCLLCTILLAVVKPLIVEPSISSSTTVHVMGAQRAGLRLSVEWRTPENIKKISSQVELFCDEGKPVSDLKRLRIGVE